MTIMLPAVCFTPLHALAMVGGLTELSSARLLYPDWEYLQDQSLDDLLSFNVSRLVSRFCGPNDQLPSSYNIFEIALCRLQISRTHNYCHVHLILHFAVCRFDTSSIAVIAYAGWGIAGTNILFKLDKTLQAGIQLPVTSPPSPAAAALQGTAPASPASSPSGSDGGSSWNVIIGVTVGVGAAMVLAAILAVVVVRARR